MRVAIMQPTYLPWLGYFDLMDQVDLFVFLDDVQFERQSWQQRNRVKTRGGLEWLTVPVRHTGRFGQEIRQVAIAEPGFWRKHLKTLRGSYARSRHFAPLHAQLADLLERGEPWEELWRLDVETILWLRGLLGVGTPTVLASSLACGGRRTGRLLSILRAVEATEYRSPIGAAGYLLEEEALFAEAGLALSFQRFEHPEYEQLFPPFVPFASALDLLFNEGEEARAVMLSGRRPALSPDEVRQRGEEVDA